MIAQTFDVKKHIKLIKKALKHDHLYNSEEIRKLKTDLRNLEKTNELVRQYQNNGFGQYMVRPVKLESTIKPTEEVTDVDFEEQVNVTEDVNEG